MTDLDLDTQLSVPAHVVSRAVGEETVLLDLESGTYFGLDRVGQLVWRCVGDGRTLGQTIKHVVEECEVDENRARNDVLAFAEELVRRGLLSNAANF